MTTKKEIKRIYSIQDRYNNKEYEQKEIIKLIIKSENNHIIQAPGGMGKSYVAQRWHKELKFEGFKFAKAQTLRLSDIQNKMIIDNLDEIPLFKAKEILKYICNNNFKQMIIFSRSEAVWTRNNEVFIKIDFKNHNNENPRYSQTFGIQGEKYYDGMNEYFRKEIKDENTFDFLSMFSFKLLTSGKINMHIEDAKEFIRKFNINNNTHITIDVFNNEKLFVRFEDDIYFENKSIPAFFCAPFLKRFAHKRRSFISHFNNFASQLSLEETAKIILSMNDGLRTAWELMTRNDFFFIFLLETNRLQNIIRYGIKTEPSYDFTNLISSIIIKSLNDNDFVKDISLYENDGLIFSTINHSQFIEIIQYGTLNKILFAKFLKFYLSWSIVSLSVLRDFKTKKLITEILNNHKFISNVEFVKHEDHQKFHRMALGMMKLEDVEIESKSNSLDSISDTIEFLVVFKNYETLVELISNYDFFSIWNNKKFQKEWNEFFEWCLENSKYRQLLLFMLFGDFPKKVNGKFIKLIPRKKLSLEGTKTRYKNISLPFEFDGKYPDIQWISTREIKARNNEKIRVSYEEFKRDIEIFDDSTIKKYEFKNYSILNTARIKEIEVIEKGCEYNFIHVENKKINNYFKKEQVHFGSKRFLNYFYEIASNFVDIKIEDIPASLLLRINRGSSLEGREFSWYKKYSWKTIERKIIDFYINIKNFKQLSSLGVLFLLNPYIDEIIRKMSNEDKEEALKILGDNKNSNRRMYFEIFYANRNISGVPKILDSFIDETKNINEYINEFPLNEYLRGKGKITKAKIKKMIEELLENIFKDFPKNYYSGVRTIQWYDNFVFGSMLTTGTLKLLILIKKVNLVKWYAELFVDKFYKAKDKGQRTAFYEFIRHINSLELLDSDINAKEIVKELKLHTAKEEHDDIDEAWLEFSGELMNTNNNKIFNISEFYRHQNDDLNIIEFSNLFEKEVLPLIDGIFKEVKNREDKVTETEIHKEINKKLPDILMREHSILYQGESNPYIHHKVRKRIDFIATRNNKFIFAELKTTSPYLNPKKLGEQLASYNSSKLINPVKFLLVFKTETITPERKQKVETVSASHGFKVVYF
ncbi:hypothetical protein [Mycoplasma todarodis]|uniref:hypothetical protein n=1 Tax=Mycoplasma todarodis TaxID=1937191 RepID=UPI003B31755C